MHLTRDEHACTSADYTIQTEVMMVRIDSGKDNDGDGGALSMRQGFIIFSKHLFRPVLELCPVLASV